MHGVRMCLVGRTNPHTRTHEIRYTAGDRTAESSGMGERPCGLAGHIQCMDGSRLSDVIKLFARKRLRRVELREAIIVLTRGHLLCTCV